MPSPSLFLVPTPIGNLEDITLRAIRTLAEVDLIACEDTRTSGVLLSHYDITTPKTSFHAHNEHRKAIHLVEQMRDGRRIALITDAGMPGISDPGYLLVRSTVEAGLRVEALPGAAAFATALAASGLPTDRFLYEGFLPPRKGRRTRLQQLADMDCTVVLYESPHRIGKLLKELGDACGPNRQLVIAREISKKFEEYLRGSVAELSAHATTRPLKGECVVVLASSRFSGRKALGRTDNSGSDPP
ncbi:MAG: 16S rRNA (cytidine(1402)-2'-O)-methyltransferase [Bacteroidetes bacterium CG12_big_fil_rev_8_21_14_0_65_60_17]|nr:MAG: 16S rRNA (cytidine(1402)-2'-O)-methyltransferase [Bacteroidetes bacterium CG12_big_fil_rev_8_21_14_0_65_60_17]